MIMEHQYSVVDGPQSSRSSIIMKLSTMQLQESTMQLQDLPVDILMNIVSRVPFETLVRWRSVCKLWYNIMNDPRFLVHAPRRDFLYLASYNNQTNKDQDFNFHLLKLVTNVGESRQVWKKSENPTNIMSKFHYYSVNSEEFVGSCKGLVCFTRKKKLHIVNPLFLNDILTVPLAPLALHRERGHDHTSISVMTYSFGFDESSKSFKAICMAGCCDLVSHGSYDLSSRPLVLDLVLGKSSISSSKFRWRRALSSPSIRHWKRAMSSQSYQPFRPLFIDEAILFLGFRKTDGKLHDLEILSFHLEKETFKIITLPISTPQVKVHLDWFDFDGRISLVWYGRDNIIRVWSLISDDEDNDMHKWVEEFQFKAPDCSSGLQAKGFDKTQSNFIFLMVYVGYFAYNTQTGITSALPNPPSGDGEKNALLLYQGSLICASNLTPLESSILTSRIRI